MTSLVLELQRDAIDQTINVSTLLRKALVVAKKLKITDIELWLSNELNGYPAGSEVPQYRYIRGELKAFNPYRGWIPLFMQAPKQAEALSKQGTSQSIAELENISDSGKDKYCYIQFPKATEQKLMKSMEIPMQPILIVSQSQIISIIETVRNSILEWALKLEENGIMGEAMSFTIKEKEQASNIIYNIKNAIGSMHNSQLQQDTINSTQSYNKSLDFDQLYKIVDEIYSRISELNLDDEKRLELETEINCLRSQFQSPRPKIEVIKECIKSTRNIIEGATGSALFQGVLTALGTLSL